MRFLTKNKHRIYVFMSCILTILIVLNGLTLPTVSVGDKDDVVGPAEYSITLEYHEISGGTYDVPALYSIAAPIAATDNNPLKLEYGSNITNITISYLVGDNWVEIKDENNSNLPANTGYQFEFRYSNISIADLLAAGGQMVYDDLPEWFVPSARGVLLFGDRKVATIEAIDDEILISFDTDWLEEQEAMGTHTLNGTFKVSGEIDWRKLPQDGSDATLPGLDAPMHFEGNLAQKYGRLDIEKSEPELNRNENGKYYLKYKLTVASLEDISMDGVIVKDKFMNPEYISGYVGITNGLNVDGLEPAETSTADQFVTGELSVDGDYMLWNIDELGPGEVRTLTYYAEIAENYVDLILNNPIQNRADVYTKDDQTKDEYPKDTDSSSFTPANDVDIKKEAGDAMLDNTGSGTITYTVTITAPETNSFELENLTLSDAFPSEISGYLSGDAGNLLTVTITTEEGVSEEKKVPYSNASFELPGLNIKPGEKITVTYTINVKNIFFYSNGNVELINSASISKGDRTLRSAANIKTIEKHTWARKIVGDPIDKEKFIEIPDGDSVYVYNGEDIVSVNDPPEGFSVPKESLKYQVVINEDGEWDLSSAQMKDKFDSNYLKYTGYVQIRLYERGGSSSGNMTDSNLIGELEKSEPVRTIWLEIDDKGEFSFKPEELGIDDNYTFLLTYYAQPVNMTNVSSVNVTNSFNIQGTVGIGDGWFELPGINVSVGKVVQGGVNYDAEKFSWYYEPSPVYVNPRGSDRYGKSNALTEYTNGAIYWVIRLDGDIGEGTASVSNNKTTLTGFYLKDVPQPTNNNNNNQTKFNRDALLGVYVAPKNLDIRNYNSFDDFIKAEPWTYQLDGNALNDKYFGDGITNHEYYWYAENSQIDGIVFPGGWQLDKENEALYIVLRTTPLSRVPAAGSNTTRIYSNRLHTRVGNLPESVADEADYIFSTRPTLHKESKGAYIYDKTKDEFKNCSDTQGGDWHIENVVDKSRLTSGTYAAWLLNVNWNSSMSGTADIIDCLPPGMELVYVDMNNLGNNVRGDLAKWPRTEYINELYNDSDWEEMIVESIIPTGGYNTAPYTTISYYNRTTGKIRWRFSNLTSGANTQRNEANLRIICKVTDPELFLNGGGKTYVNKAAVLDEVTSQPTEMENASVTITREIGKNIDEIALKDLDGALNGNTITGKLNRIPFELNINPLGEDMCDGDTLPALIDEFSQFLLLIEDSIEIYVGEAKYTDFTYTVEETNGQQTLFIYGLPDGVPITIKYAARIDALPDSPTQISNKAYWAGYTPPNNSQVSDKSFKYSAGGDVFANKPAAVNITKVDSDSHSKKLSGAEFELYEVNKDGTLKEPAILTDTSDSMGNVTFGGADNPVLEMNKVYCIKEKNSPNGYRLDDTPHYFVIIEPGGLDDFDSYGIDDLDKWYESPEYSIIIKNTKGTISAEKVFLGKTGEEYTPTSGKYRFGLFDYTGKLLEVLTIEYTESETKYYLDDIPKNGPNFTKFEPEGVYQIYELDESRNPITEGGIARINGSVYQATYSAEQIIVGETVTVTNQKIEINLPDTGGHGPIIYCLLGGMLILISVLVHMLLRFKIMTR